jgi:hypothetical protein
LAGAGDDLDEAAGLAKSGGEGLGRIALKRVHFTHHIE